MATSSTFPNYPSHAGPSRPSQPGSSRQIPSTGSIDLTGDSEDEDTVNQGVFLNTGARATQTSNIGSSQLGPSFSSPFPFLPSHRQDMQASGSGSYNHPALSSSPGSAGQYGSGAVSIPGMNPTPHGAPPNGWIPFQPGNSNPAPSNFMSNGISPSSAIDLTKIRIPSPPPIPNDKKPICIGSIMSQAIMLYPSPAAVQGGAPPEGSREKFTVVTFRGAEMLKVKLKLRQAGSKPRPDEPWAAVSKDVIQVMTPGMSCYIGDLEQSLGDLLIQHISRGLVRLEGFILRLSPEAPQFEVRINVLLFTLPSNVRYLADNFFAHNIFLLDPVPPYDPARHSDRPLYHNAHGGQEMAMRLQALAQNRLYGSQMALASSQLEKVTQVEVQRKQVDEVFQSLESGGELEQSAPGPLIKTKLFPHQRRALTFLLQREQDWSAMKQARRYGFKEMKRDLPKAEREGLVEDKDKEVEEKAKAKDSARSLWEGRPDGKGRIRVWRNKITGEETKSKKGDRPRESKGSILADDMGLGKTLSVVSLIAATRRSAEKWARSKLESDEVVVDAEGSKSNGLNADVMTTRVFGMPTVDSDDESTAKGKGKKRKREEAAKVTTTTRRSRLTQKSRATLLICPMSTITTWEDQIKEHWDGQVEIIGGTAGILPPKKVEKIWKPPKKDGVESDDSKDANYDVLKVYIYHGPSRRLDPEFISDFDVVITSYNTLALEYTKQGGASGDDTAPATPGETAGNSDDDGMEVMGNTSVNSRAVKPEVEAEIKASEVADALIKGKKKGGGRVKISGETSPLQAIEWFRVVLDEAHYIKTATTVASQASCDLETDRRVALTGTPIQNKIEDVWALFRFLRLNPIDDKEMFTKYISNPCKFGEQIGVARLQLVMRCCTLRRTKDSTTDDGKKILNLPPRKEVQLWLDLREDERAAYDSRKEAVTERVKELRARNELGKNYANVLQEILRLRQICDHVDLARSGAVEEDYDGTVMDYEVAIQGIERQGLTQARAVSVVCFLNEGPGALCKECGYDFGDYFPTLGLGGIDDGIKLEEGKRMKKLTTKPLLTKCLHFFCQLCFKKAIHSGWSRNMKDPVGRQCGACSTILRLPADVVEVYPPDEAGDAPEQTKRAVRKKYVRPPGERPNLSTKMQYLHDELLKYSKLNRHSPNFDPFNPDIEVAELDESGAPLITKSVVFSQWTTMLDRIGDMLLDAKIGFARLDGTMTREERAKATDALKLKKSVEVLLVSTRAGGVGLNLTTASRCYLVDPYWNPSVEAQAIDRIHRMGQTRPVTAVKLMINDSIEMKLDEIQRKKANLAQLSLKNMTRKELMAQKAEELASLFK